jgi:hypothetical protein
MTGPVCPCDGAAIAPPTNLPALSHIAYRIGTYTDFRRAVLTPLPGEQALSIAGVPVWRTDGAGDLAVMAAEWFATIADILTFYNERIANQDYLRTADLPDSVTHLIALLGYRPRPAISATGTLAALVAAGQSTILPKGLQFQSKPSPGQQPQTFELMADTRITPPDQLPAAPNPVLLAELQPPLPWLRSLYRSLSRVIYEPRPIFGKWFGLGTYGVLLRGAVSNLAPQSLLLLRPRDPSLGPPLLAAVQAVTTGPAPGGGQQTALTITLSGTPPAGLAAAQADLQQPNQAATPWSFFAGAISGLTVHLASLVRQIRPGDWLLFTQPSSSPAPALAQVLSTSETIWDATGSSTDPTTPKDPNHPLPVPHTVLTLTAPLPNGWNNVGGAATIRFDWVPACTLIDQPYGQWSGTPTALVATGAPFPAASGLPILLMDANGAGMQATGSSTGDNDLLLGGLPSPVPTLQPPFTVLPNLLPVSRGKTVAKEILGSGDATNPAQDFQLSQSPVTYLQEGAGWASTISLTVGGQPWTEVPSFYGQPANATVFVTREDDGGNTHVMFGDGVNGARLPTGVNNIVATYRVGADAASPPAGKLTVITQSFPGLRAVLNPVAVGGGADPDPPDQIRRYAPRSVLAFGRAVSVFDYQAIAAQVPGVTRASAVWAWNDARQRTVVTVYVGDNPAAVTAAKTALAAAGDPNRPVLVTQATQIPVALSLTVITVPGMDTGAISAAVIAALTDPDSGMFGPVNMAIGQTIFDSQLEAAILAVAGTVAITGATFIAAGVADPGPLHNPGEGGYYTLDPLDITLVTEPGTNGG